MDPQLIKTTLEKAISASAVEVVDLTGGGDHFQVVIVSAAFQGKSLIDQHKMVYGALKEELGSERIHALALKTYTPEQWRRIGSTP